MIRKERAIDSLKKALMEARAEYNRLIEMERIAEPEFVDYYVYRIKDQSEILESLKLELMMEMERVG